MGGKVPSILEESEKTVLASLEKSLKDTDAKRKGEILDAWRGFFAGLKVYEDSEKYKSVLKKENIEKMSVTILGETKGKNGQKLPNTQMVETRTVVETFKKLSEKPLAGVLQIGFQIHFKPGKDGPKSMLNDLIVCVLA